MTDDQTSGSQGGSRVSGTGGEGSACADEGVRKPEVSFASDADGYVKGAVLLYYAYEPIADPVGLVAKQISLSKELDLRGRVRVCFDGINGTVSSHSVSALEKYCSATAHDIGRCDIDWKLSPLDDNCFEPFADFSAKQVRDMVGADPDDSDSAKSSLRSTESHDSVSSVSAKSSARTAENHGTCRVSDFDGKVRYSKQATAPHLTPEEFHQKVINAASDDIALIDVRNSYEYQIGHFKGAIDPRTRKFSEFEKWFRDSGAALVKGKKQVLMYCTGGIRCETASISVKKVLSERCEKGAEPQVFQLNGGIHRYLESYGPSESKFLGRNFVFDSRVTQPLPSHFRDQQDKLSVVGKCLYCSCPWENLIDDRRCKKCRTLVLACDSCASHDQGVWCDEHIVLDPRRRTLQAIKELRKKLTQRLAQVPKGRKSAAKRRRITKQLRELDQA